MVQSLRKRRAFLRQQPLKNRWANVFMYTARFSFSIITIPFSCTLVQSLYVNGVRSFGVERQHKGRLDAVRMYRLRKQIQAQGLPPAAHKVRMPEAAELQVPLLCVPRLPEAQSAAARAPSAQRSAREGGLRGHEVGGGMTRPCGRATC